MDPWHSASSTKASALASYQGFSGELGFDENLNEDHSGCFAKDLAHPGGKFLAAMGFLQ